MEFEFRNLDYAAPVNICEAFRCLIHEEKTVVLKYGLFDASLYEWIIGNNIWKKIVETHHMYLYPLNNNSTQFMGIDIAYADSDRPNVIILKMKDDNTMKKQLNSIFGLDSIARYCDSDVTSTRIAYNNMYKNTQMNLIKNVIFNDPATIILWNDGSKTVVKCGEGEVYDPEKGLAMAISKKVLGNKGDYYETFKKWLPEKESEFKSVWTTTIAGRDVHPGAMKFDGKWLVPFKGLKKEDSNE